MEFKDIFVRVCWLQERDANYGCLIGEGTNWKGKGKWAMKGRIRATQGSRTGGVMLPLGCSIPTSLC